MAISAAGYEIGRLDAVEREELAKKLTPEERYVLLDHGTERPFCGTLLNNKKKGTYVCRLCNLPLFSSDSKFDSGTGWPSFFAPVDLEHITYIEDVSYGMRRIEIRCRRCDGHLGHMFPDGPQPTGHRYCLNSLSMDFVEDVKPDEA